MEAIETETDYCRDCPDRCDPEMHAAVARVRGWLRKQVLLSIKPVRPFKGKPKPKPAGGTRIVDPNKASF